MVKIALSDVERKAYLIAEREMQGRWRELCAMGRHTVSQNIFLAMSMLTPMRRICSGGLIDSRDLKVKFFPKLSANPVARLGAAPSLHPQPLALTMGNDPAGAQCASCGLEPENGVQARCCGAWACHECLLSALEEEGSACPGCSKALRRADVPDFRAPGPEGFWADSEPAPGPASGAIVPVTDTPASSGPVSLDSKVKTLLKELELARAADPAAKMLVFSSFAPSLSFLATKLAEAGYTSATITGSMSLAARAKALHAFRMAPPTTIFLLSLRAGAVGLNLTAASHVVLLEPCFNPALEEQAIGRVLRLGQTRAVTVKRLVVSDSVEERMMRVVAKRVASGGAHHWLDRTQAVRELEAKVGAVAGGMASDRALLRLDEMDVLFGTAA